MENKYYQHGDSIILVIKILESTNGKIFICLNYSSNHRIYDIRTYSELEFLEYFVGNEIDFEFDDLSFYGIVTV